MNENLLRAAFNFHQAGNLAEAARLYGEVLRGDPRHFDALYLLGFAEYQRGQFEAAERLMAEAVKVNPRSLDALYNRAAALLQLNRQAEALSVYDAALALKPDGAEFIAGRGAALSSLGRHEEALAAYDKALALRPALATAWNHRGNALLELKRYEEAVASYERAVAIKPDYAEALRLRGLALAQLTRWEDALASVEQALAIKPDDADALEERGNLLMRLNRHAEAVMAYDGALASNPENIHALYNRGNALSILKRFEEAMCDCESVLSRDPDYPYARGVLIHCKLQCCDWHGLNGERGKIAMALDAGKRVVSPFNHKTLSDSAAEQWQCAKTWVRNECPPSPTPLWRGERYGHDRIRLAYVSADFNLSAVATLMAGVFEHHDHKRFETIAVSFGPDIKTSMCDRLERAFEHFDKTRALNDAAIAALIRRREVDIAVDLMGFTGECRSGIFALRPAPVQVNYLGFPGTMGADYIDYIVADRSVIPRDDRKSYSEKVVTLQGSYLPSDGTRPIAARTPSRAEAGLPERGFVFASFNNAYKFMPAMFDVWMRLLSSVEGSVLWLPRHHAAAVRNLSREAEARGVPAARLVFAPPVAGSAEHLARLRLADLFLDTLPYNAHSTANDALWAGLPVLTCAGHSFAGRVAASLLQALDLPELIADSLSAYQAAALKFARDESALASVRAKLAKNRDTSLLFDTARYTRNLEAAFAHMWERQQKGEPPADFAVDGARAIPP
jgi:predicted O-linked N-acetylglucosamine transferase (SPINDLY family)